MVEHAGQGARVFLSDGAGGVSVGVVFSLR